MFDTKGYEQAVDNLAYHIAILIRNSTSYTENPLDAILAFMTDEVSREQAYAIDRVIEAVAREYDLSEDSLMLDVMDQVDARLAAVEVKEAIEGFWLR